VRRFALSFSFLRRTHLPILGLIDSSLLQLTSSSRRRESCPMPSGRKLRLLWEMLRLMRLPPLWVGMEEWCGVGDAISRAVWR
jgi:hypothetical protein